MSTNIKSEAEIEETVNLIGIYDNNGKEIFHKIRIKFTSKKNAELYAQHPYSLIKQTILWLNCYFPKEHIEHDEFDLDSEGEWETADSYNNIIIAPAFPCLS